MSRPDNTIKEVSEYVDAPECKETSRCRWKEKWIRSSLCKVGEKSLLRFSAPGPEGREENKILPKGWKIRKKGSQDLELDGENRAKTLSKKSKEEILIDLEEQRKNCLLTKP